MIVANIRNNKYVKYVKCMIISGNWTMRLFKIIINEPKISNKIAKNIRNLLVIKFEFILFINPFAIISKLFILLYPDNKKYEKKINNDMFLYIINIIWYLII